MKQLEGVSLRQIARIMGLTVYKVFKVQQTNEPSPVFLFIEKKLGKSLFNALEHIQDNMVETVATILWGAMQPLNAGFTIEKAYGLYDNYIDEGHSLEELMQEINSLFEASGFFRKGQA